MQLHPIVYVPDPYAERAFYEAFGFERTYEGDEFPDFLAIRHGEAVIGLSRASEGRPAYTGGLRWQLEVGTAAEIERIADVCRAQGFDHETLVEEGGDRFRVPIVRVTAPSGTVVWFEGPNSI